MPLAIYIHLIPKVSKWGPNKFTVECRSWHIQIAKWSSECHYSTSCVSTRRRIFRIVGCFNQHVFKSLEKSQLSGLPVSVCGSKLFKTADQADFIFSEQWETIRVEIGGPMLGRLLDLGPLFTVSVTNNLRIYFAWLLWEPDAGLKISDPKTHGFPRLTGTKQLQVDRLHITSPQRSPKAPAKCSVSFNLLNLIGKYYLKQW